MRRFRCWPRWRRCPRGYGSGHSCSTSTCGTRRCWRRIWPASMYCPAAGWRSGSAQAGTGRNTMRSAYRSTPSRPGSRGWARRSRYSRAASATGRSHSPVSTTRSSGMTGYPKPVQRPHPPLFIGGGGRRVLTLATRQAQIVGLAPRLMPGDQAEPKPDPRSMTAAAAEEKIGWIREAAGDRFGQLELNTYPSAGPVVITNQARPEAERRADRLRQLTGVEITADDVLDSPHVFIGSIDGLTQKIVELRERFGISSIMTGEIDELAPVVERLAGR